MIVYGNNSILEEVSESIYSVFYDSIGKVHVGKLWRKPESRLFIALFLVSQTQCVSQCSSDRYCHCVSNLDVAKEEMKSKLV